MVYDKCRIMPLNVAFCNFMTDLYIRKPQGDSVKEPPCGFHFIYALLTALYRPVSYLLRYSRYRNVAIWPRVLDADRLLRLLGVSGKLSGFYYAVYMLEQVQQKPDHVLLITKRLYKQTAQHFETTSGCVERNLRTLVRACWRQPDHTLLDQIAGRPLRKSPTNMQFLDMLSAYLRK